MRHLGRIAVGISGLALLSAVLLAARAQLVARQGSQLWVQVALLTIPSVGGLWVFGRRDRPTPHWLFIWIVAAAIGIGTAIASGLDNLSGTNPESDYGAAMIGVLVTLQAASCLWAADALKRSQSSK